MTGVTKYVANLERTNLPALSSVHPKTTSQPMSVAAISRFVSELLAAAMHREHAHTGSAANQQVAAVAGLEGAAVLCKPPFKLATGHGRSIQQYC